ncbi:MAG TPA: hypothetical protein VFD62_11395 [Pyrinomonadaceae bacterium]|nr:hypothetical protein [Pyrinomonadaceae bacterium]
MNVGFNLIFWGLLFVVLDIRISSVDLVLPDFVGYILIASGLSRLASHHQWFRTARIFAIILIFVSLTTLVEIAVDAKQAPRLKREWISTLTGELSTLLPRQVNSARLIRTTRSATEIDANRTHNPPREEDRILGEYSDGTVILVLRYGSPEEALNAMKLKTETEYSHQGIRKRAETDESFKADTMQFPHGSTGHDGSTISAYSNVNVADRAIQQWWSLGWTLWNPGTWGNEGLDSRLLYIVEGHQSSAEDYRLAFEGSKDRSSGVTIDPLFPISAVANILDILLIWGICSGIIALALSSNNFELMQVAKFRRNLYLGLAVPAVLVSIMPLVAPEALLDVITSIGILLLMIYAVLVVVSVLLVMGLVRKAAIAVK